MPWRRILVVAAVVLPTMVACQPANQRGRPARQSVQVSVVDEGGAPVTSAVMRAIGNTKPIEIPGIRELKIDQPVAGTIEAEGYLAEPFVIDPADGSVTVKLFSRKGPSGAERLSFQFGGDVMMGRRYQEPVERSDTPIATTDAGARSVVRHIAPIMAAADVSTVNLETVVGELPKSDAYPAKRFLLESPPVVLAALHALGVDVVTLGNNHAYDWQEPGVASTIAALDGAGIAWVGAGSTTEQAQAGRMIEIRGTKIGVVSATTVNGDFVNDNLPTADEVKPSDLPAAEAWQYEERMFGFGEVGDPAYVPAEMRRPGEAWSAFVDIESLLGADQSGALWAAMAKVYPELQDWVARRDHGGAAPFQSEAIERSITALRNEGADLVIVEIHGGFQFSDVASEFAIRAAHASIDAGADLVVDHHPHVLQGLEWYKGHLIAYSLGNFVFDQDFLSTFPSAILRTVFEGDRLIDARIIPLTLDRYQPVPVAGTAAARVIRLLNSRSALTAYSDRIAPRIITSVIDRHLPANAVITDTGMTGQITDQRDSAAVAYQLDDSGQALLPPCAIVRTGSFDGEIGVDLLQWGDIDDVTADNSTLGAAQWALTGKVTAEVEDENQYLKLAPTQVRGASARTIARPTTPLHRWYDANFEPVDGEPKYSVQLRTRGQGVVDATLRIAAYDVDDTDPTSEPESTLLKETSLPLVVPDSTDWRDLDIDVTSIVNEQVGGVRANAVLVYVIVPRESPELDIDDVRLMEWRDPLPAADGVWMPADALRGAPRAQVSVEQSGCAAPAG
jgi:poly-gamma-glutamate capsule biosynthesis protein CapA/YwtB (metallophosphatase superfamily)